MQNTKKSFLLFEALISMVLILIFIVSFMYISSFKQPISSYALDMIYKEAIKSKCEAINTSKNILGMDLEQSYQFEYNNILQKDILVQYFTLDSKVVLKKRCYI